MSYRYWIATVPFEAWTPPETLSEPLVYCRGQQERGDSGYHHWQLLLLFSRPVRLPQAKRTLCPTAHLEPTRSVAAEAYCWKETTRVAGTQFELGRKPSKRNSKTDWDLVLANAKQGRLDDIPADVLVRCYSAISRIRKDYMAPVAQERTVHVFWGATGTGKSRDAWAAAGLDAFPKDPSTKWWDGYRDQEHVVIDEFRGRVAIEHLLRWFDRYPVCVETKGGATVLRATRIWITSNLSPDNWFPELDADTLAALRRRLNITHYN